MSILKYNLVKYSHNVGITRMFNTILKENVYMGRAEYRKFRKDFKVTTKVIFNSVKKDIDSILDFIKENTTQAELVLALTENDTDGFVERLVKSLSRPVMLKLQDSDGFDAYRSASNMETKDSTWLLASSIFSENTAFDLSATIQSMLTLKYHGELLNDESLSKLTKAKMGTLYRDSMIFIVTTGLLDTIPLIRLDKSQLVSFSDTLEFIMTAVKGWLLLKQFKLNSLGSKGWIDECDTLQDVFEMLELPEEIAEALTLLLVDTDTELSSEEIMLVKRDDIEKLIPLHSKCMKAPMGDIDNLISDADIPDILKSLLEEVVDSAISDEDVCLDLLQRTSLTRMKCTKTFLESVSYIVDACHQSDVSDLDDTIESLKTKLSKTETSLKTQKETCSKLKLNVAEYEKAIRQLKKQKTSSKELESALSEIVSLKNQNEKLKAHINNLKSVDTTTTPTEVTELPSIKLEEVLETQVVKVTLDEMLEKINQHKLTILGGPTNFSSRVKEYIPDATVIDGSSKFGQIRIGSSDYVVVYWKILGHARTMQAEAQAKRVGAKIIQVDSTNKNLFCKQVFDQL